MVVRFLRRGWRAYAAASVVAMGVGSEVPARAQAPADPCMTPDLVQAVLQAANEANAKDGKELTGVVGGRTTARTPNGLTCTYDGTTRVTDGSGTREAKVVVTGTITVSADGTDIETHLEQAK